MNKSSPKPSSSDRMPMLQKLNLDKVFALSVKTFDGRQRGACSKDVFKSDADVCSLEINCGSGIAFQNDHCFGEPKLILNSPQKIDINEESKVIEQELYC